MRRRRLLKLAIVGLPVTLLGVGASCGGVSESDYKVAQDKATEADQKATALQSQLSELQQKLSTQTKEETSVTRLIWAEPRPTPTAPPTPTALPAGVTPKAKATVPASYSEPVPFAFYVETLATSSISKFGFASFPSCVPNSRFKRGSKLVWRFEVFDTAAGKRLTDLDEPGIKVVLPHGEELTARFSQRAGGRVPDAPWMWATAWDIPPDYPIGSLDYSILVTTKDGRTAIWKQPALIAPDLGIDSRVSIVE